MAIERERKFLVKYLTYEMLNNNWVRFDQMYLVADIDKQLRIRICYYDHDITALITFKEHINDTDRNEYEYEMKVDEALKVLDEKEYISILKKKRTNFDGWDIDVYPNNLMVAEYEYSDENPFPETLPDWIGNEITGDGYYSNINLAEKK